MKEPVQMVLFKFFLWNRCIFRLDYYKGFGSHDDIFSRILGTPTPHQGSIALRKNQTK